MLNLATRPVETDDEDPADDNQYAVGSRLEITQILSAIMRQGALVTASPGDDSFFLTSITAVDDDEGTLQLECGRQPQQNENVLRHQHLVCSTALDKVKIKFACKGIELVESARGLAFRMPLPREMTRLQRREHFRMPIPLSAPVKCVLSPIDAEQGPAAKVELSVHDISGGGVAIMTPPALFTPEIGAHYHCTIGLPVAGKVQARIQARNAFMITLANGKVTQRSGFAFVRPAESLLATIQRYIMNLERARRVNGTRG